MRATPEAASTFQDAFVSSYWAQGLGSPLQDPSVLSDYHKRTELCLKGGGVPGRRASGWRGLRLHVRALWPEWQWPMERAGSQETLARVIAPLQIPPCRLPTRRPGLGSRPARGAHTACSQGSRQEDRHEYGRPEAFRETSGALDLELGRQRRIPRPCAAETA